LEARVLPEHPRVLPAMVTGASAARTATLQDRSGIVRLRK
jgi:hypothetical protein